MPNHLQSPDRADELVLRDIIGLAAWERMSLELPSKVPALTIKQPWAWLLTTPLTNDGEAIKQIENRTWKPKLPLGWMAIHAGKSFDKAAVEYIYERLSCRNQIEFAAALEGENKEYPMHRGGIIAIANHNYTLEPGESTNPFHASWFSGPYGWMIHDVMLLPRPLPRRGKQGIFYVAKKEILECWK